MSGTSMASPFISGLAALYLEKYNKDPQKIKQFQYHLLNTAEPMYESSEGKGDLKSVIHQGAGIVKPHRLLSVEDYISPRKLELAKIYVQKQVHKPQITIHNQGITAKTYSLKHAPAASINMEDVLKTKKEAGVYAKVTFQQSQVTIPPKGSVIVNVTIDSGAMFRKKKVLYSGYVYVVDKATKEILRVPYMGYSGDKSEFKALQQPKLFHIRNEVAVGTFTDDTSSTSAKLMPALETSLSERDFIIVDFVLQVPPSLLVIAFVNASDPRQTVQVIKRIQLTFSQYPVVEKNAASEKKKGVDISLTENAVKIVKSIRNDKELPPNENYRIKVTAHTPQREPHEWLSPVFLLLP
jgi:hypothetical protein